jgi:hypothetical protein
MKQLLFLIFMSFTLFSCKSDKQKIEDAKQVVETFVKDIELENYTSASKIYPSFSKVGKYWILYDFKITDSKIDNEEVTTYGTYKQYNTREESIMFVLEPSESDGKYYIKRTKGLSAYFGSNIYLFFKNVGCLRGLETDEEIAKACKEREVVFTSLVTQAAIAQQESVIMESHSVSNSYGYISGDITVKNTSNTTIPAFTYDIYIIFTDANGNEIYREKSISNVYQIPSHGSISVMVHQQSLRGMAKIGIEFKLTKTDWLESDIANDPSDEITCEKIDEIIRTQL